jgi:methylated-DNA-protein-cysteine methyltransferase-like protein
MRTALLNLIAGVPTGRVASVDALAEKLGVPLALVPTMLAQLTEDERELFPWHRVVAKGGAIGRGPHRDRQFARLVREGVMVSPAGVVQDLARVMVKTFDERTPRAENLPDASPEPAKPGGRSRGMKSRP